MRYKVGDRVSILCGEERLNGVVEKIANLPKMYWVRVDGSRRGYYPEAIIAQEDEMRPMVIDED